MLDVKRDSSRKLWRKYRYACGILALGLLLLMLPGRGSSGSDGGKTGSAVQLPETEAAEKRLAALLGNLRGVGKVRVLLSYAASEEHTYIKDEGQTVLVSAGSGRQEPLEKKTVYPVYQGAVILCEGADDAKVQLYVLEAVQQFTGLRTDQISVLPLA